MFVLLMPAVTVSMLLVASPVPVTRDTLEMGSHVEVSIVICIRYNNSADINECTSRIANCHTIMLPVPTLLVASPVPVTRDTLELGCRDKWCK